MSAKPSGLFFGKSAKPRAGRFFRDLPGRDDATFHEKTAMDDAPTATPVVGSASNISPGGMVAGGEGVGGGMYGTGKPKKAAPTKTASKTPSDWDADSGLPTGFHRPAREQPEALESGGERFHSSEARAPNFGAESSRHGLVEGGSMKMPATAGSQMGKHAAIRFLGTVYSEKTAASAEEYTSRAQNYAGARAGEAKKSLSTFGRGLAGKADEAVKGITQSPTTSAIAALVLGKMGLGAGKGVGRGASRMVGRKPAPSIAGNALGGLRKLITGR